MLKKKITIKHIIILKVYNFKYLLQNIIEPLNTIVS